MPATDTRIEQFQIQRGNTVETYAFYTYITSTDAMSLLLQEGILARANRTVMSSESPITREVRDILTTVRTGGV